MSEPFVIRHSTRESTCHYRHLTHVVYACLSGIESWLFGRVRPGDEIPVTMHNWKESPNA